jgi:serine/threonine protein phosphatase 1
MLQTPIADEVNAGPALPPRTYAIGDVHGRLDLLRSAVDAISNHLDRPAFRVIFLGDYVDRGPDSRGVIDFLMELQKQWPVTCLKGNHEELMLQALTNPGGGRLSRWVEYGGGATLKSYGLTPDDDLTAGVPAEHLRWMSSLPRTTGDRHRIYVHAGLMPGTPVHRQNDQTCLWIRERFLQANAKEFEAHVVHGHTPVWEGKPDAAEPELLDHRTNLDTAAFATGVLSVAIFDADTPGGPVEMLKIRGKSYGRITADPAEDAQPAVPEAKQRRRRRLVSWFGPRASAVGAR